MFSFTSLSLVTLPLAFPCACRSPFAGPFPFAAVPWPTGAVAHCAHSFLGRSKEVSEKRICQGTEKGKGSKVQNTKRRTWSVTVNRSWCRKVPLILYRKSLQRCRWRSCLKVQWALGDDGCQPFLVANLFLLKVHYKWMMQHFDYSYVLHYF